LIQEMGISPLPKKVKVCYTVLRERPAQLWQMSIDQGAQNLTIEREPGHASLIELPHIVILDQAHSNPKGAHLVLRMIQDTGDQLAQAHFWAVLSFLLSHEPPLGRADVDRLVVRSIGRYDVEQAVGNRFLQVDGLLQIFIDYFFAYFFTI